MRVSVRLVAGARGTPAIVLAAHRLRQQRLDQNPLRVRQQLELLLAHATRTSNLLPYAKVSSLRQNIFMKHALTLLRYVACLPSTRQYTSVVFAAARAHVYRPDRCRPRSRSSFRSSLFSRMPKVARAKDVASLGSISNAASPLTSDKAPLFDVTTGNPAAKASATGSPNPSLSEGNRSKSASAKMWLMLRSLGACTNPREDARIDRKSV